MITQSETHTSTTSQKPKHSSDETVEVACRIKDYHGDYPCIANQGDNYVRLTRPLALNRDVDKYRIYQFDHVCDGNDSQSTVFERYGMDLLEDLVNGRNTSLFVYGYGKANTMLGNKDECKILLRVSDVLFNSIPLLTNRFVFYPDGRNGFHIRSEAQAFEEQSKLSPIKEKIWSREREPEIIKFPLNMAVAVFVSYLEICNDQFHDLLDDSESSEFRSDMSKDIINDSNGHAFVDRLTEIEVQSSDEVLTQYLKAEKRQKMAKTSLSANSSRSHSIFNIRLVMCEAALANDFFGRVHPVEEESKIIVSQLSIVKLAGSEKCYDTQNCLTAKESLLSLRKCFHKLQKKQRRGINATNGPYRDNKLTHLFESYFEGNGRMRMIICVNPQPQDFEKNLVSLNFFVYLYMLYIFQLAMSFGAIWSNDNYIERELEEEFMINLRYLRIPEFDNNIEDLRNFFVSFISKINEIQRITNLFISFGKNLNELITDVREITYLRRHLRVIMHHVFRLNSRRIG